MSGHKLERVRVEGVRAMVWIPFDFGSIVMVAVIAAGCLGVVIELVRVVASTLGGGM